MRRAILLLALVLPLWLAPRAAFALGGNVLIYATGSSSTLGYGGLSQQLMIAGAPSVSYDWPSDLAASYRLVFLMDCQPLDAGQVSDLQALVANGGGVVMAAEPIDGVSALNDVAAALGVNERLVDNDVYDGCNSAPLAVAQPPLTDQVPAVSVSRSTTVMGGTTLYGDISAPVVSVEGTVLLAGDTNIFSDSGCLGCCSESPETVHFWENIYHSLPVDPSGMGGTDDAGVADDMTPPAVDPGSNGGGGCAFAGSGAFTFAPLACVLLLIALARRRRA